MMMMIAKICITIFLSEVITVAIIDFKRTANFKYVPKWVTTGERMWFTLWIISLVTIICALWLM